LIAVIVAQNSRECIKLSSFRKTHFFINKDSQRFHCQRIGYQNELERRIPRVGQVLLLKINPGSNETRICTERRVSRQHLHAEIDGTQLSSIIRGSEPNTSSSLVGEVTPERSNDPLVQIRKRELSRRRRIECSIERYKSIDRNPD